MRVSIRQKLTLSFLLVALLVALLGMVGYSNMRETGKQVDVITKLETPGLVKLTEMKSHILEGVEEAMAYPLLDDPLEKAEFYTKLEQFDTSVAEFKEITGIGQPGQEEETELFKQIVTAKAVLAIAAGHMFESFERDGTVTVSRVAALENEIDTILPLIDRLLEIESEEVAEAREDIEATIANAERLTLIVVSVPVLLAVVLGILVSRSISIPINKLKDVAEELGKGNLGIRANIESSDEIGSLANSFNQMAAERQQAEEAQQRWTEETEVMAEIGRTVSASLDINEVYARLGEEICKLIPFDRMIINMVDQCGESVSHAFVLGTEVPGRQHIPLAGTFAEEVIRTRSPVMLEADKEPDLRQRFPGLLTNYHDGMRSFLAAPLFYRDDIIGVLQIRSKERGVYSQLHLDLAERIGNQIAGALANSQLYAQQKDAEEQIRASLDEKEVLLKEINHRVKNNLQVISSVLNLQSRDIRDEQALRSFQVCQDRVRAMALVHEKLYQSKDLARIDFGEYIKSLATGLESSYGLPSRNIDLKIEVEDILLGVNTAIPCGVIVNELMTNPLKHAFPRDRSGVISISFREIDGQYMMVFKDDGVGLPEDLDITHPSSLGLTIVNALTGQLGGAIDLGRNGGSEVSITFPVG